MSTSPCKTRYSNRNSRQAKGFGTKNYQAPRVIADTISGGFGTRYSEKTRTGAGTKSSRCHFRGTNRMLNIIKERVGDTLSIRLTGAVVGECVNLETLIGSTPKILRVNCKNLVRLNSN